MYKKLLQLCWLSDYYSLWKSQQQSFNWRANVCAIDKVYNAQITSWIEMHFAPVSKQEEYIIHSYAAKLHPSVFVPYYTATSIVNYFYYYIDVIKYPGIIMSSFASELKLSGKKQTDFDPKWF